MIFANKLKKARNARSLSQSQAAGVIGCSVRVLQGWEAGKEPPEYVQRLVLKELNEK